MFSISFKLNLSPLLPSCRVALLFSCETTFAGLLVILGGQLVLTFTAMGWIVRDELESEFHG